LIARRIIYIALAGIIAVSTFAQIDLPPEKFDYVLFWGDKRIGYFTYTLKPVSGGWEMRSETFMAVSADGKPGKIFMLTHWELNQFLKPYKYELSVLSDEKQKRHLTVDISGQTAHIREGDSERIIDLPENTYILETMLPDGWVLFSRKLDVSRDSALYAAALVPQIGKVLPLSLFQGNLEKTAGEKTRKFAANIGGIEIEFSAKIINRMITYWSAPAQGITIRYTPQLNKEEIQAETVSVDILKDMMPQNRLPADIEVTSPILLDRITAEIELQIDENTVILLENKYQSFAGDTAGWQITGEIKTRLETFRGKSSMAYPVGPIVEPLPGTLAPSKNIQSDAAEIVSVAKKISAGCEDIWCVAKKANRFVADSIKLGTETVSAKTALLISNGAPLSHARLCCAILRASGVPARVVGGLLLDQGFWIRHHWVEAWTGEKPGWIPIDPSTGEDMNFSPAHIQLWLDEGALKPSKDNSVRVESFELKN